MTIRAKIIGSVLGLAVVLVTSNSALFSNAYADGAAAPSPTIKSALEVRTGKPAKIKLVSGQDIEGRVQSVGAEVVVIAELTGMEFFSATVRIDQVAAVIYRTDAP